MNSAVVLSSAKHSKILQYTSKNILKGFEKVRKHDDDITSLNKENFVMGLESNLKRSLSNKSVSRAPFTFFLYL